MREETRRGRGRRGDFPTVVRPGHAPRTTRIITTRRALAHGIAQKRSERCGEACSPAGLELHARGAALAWRGTPSRGTDRLGAAERSLQRSRALPSTVTWNWALDSLPHASVAVQVTSVVPRGKKLPEGGAHTTFGAGS
jgi:hypothetical protein